MKQLTPLCLLLFQTHLARGNMIRSTVKSATSPVSIIRILNNTNDTANISLSNNTDQVLSENIDILSCDSWGRGVNKTISVRESQDIPSTIVEFDYNIYVKNGADFESELTTIENQILTSVAEEIFEDCPRLSQDEEDIRRLMNNILYESIYIRSHDALHKSGGKQYVSLSFLCIKPNIFSLIRLGT